LSDREINKILVIKLSSLGDFIQALGAMAAIRRHHKDAEITLLTTKPYKELAEDCGYFDKVWLDSRPSFHELDSWWRLRKTLLGGNFDRVYDLQNSDRTAIYFRLFPAGKRPEWVGVVKGASHRNVSPDRAKFHALDGHRQTLALAGIDDVDIDDLSWMNADISRLDIPEQFALMVPGSSAKHPEKRWPAKSYAALGCSLYERGITPLILGTLSEKEIASSIIRDCPSALNFAGQTSIYEIAVLSRKAKLAVGNDTGPMHIIAATGCPSVVLFSKHTNPVKHGPKGKKVVILRNDELQNLAPDEVFDAAMAMF
jgi:ADP-heptose:LPS heptosyltransferase